MIEDSYPKKEYRVYRDEDGDYLGQVNDRDYWEAIADLTFFRGFTTFFNTAEKAERACRRYAEKDKKKWIEKQTNLARSGVVKELGKLP